MKIRSLFQSGNNSNENRIFWIVIIIHLIPLWSTPFFPSQDGPVHLENAYILGTYSDPGSELNRQYYFLNTLAPSNWLIQLLLAALLGLFRPELAMTILISGYIILLPLSFRYCLRSFNPDTTVISFLIFPFVYNYTLHMGFFGFCYSLVLFFFLIGFWIRFQEHISLKTGISLALLILTTYLFHIVSLVMGIAALLVLILFFHRFGGKADSASAQRGQLSSRIVYLLLVSLPAFFIMSGFLFRQGSTIAYSSHMIDRLIQLAALTSLFSFVRLELLISCTLVIFITLIAVPLIKTRWQQRKSHPSDGLMIIAALYLLIYFAAPDRIAGGEVINARLMLYPYFILLIWLGSYSWREEIKRLIMPVAIILSIIQLGMYTQLYRQINDYISEYLSAGDLIEEQTLLLPLSFYDNRQAGSTVLPRYRVNPFRHLASRLAVRNRCVELDNYQAWHGYFPVQYRAHLNPMDHLAINNRLETVPPEIDLPAYIFNTGRQIDYILIWGLENAHLNQPGSQNILKQLDDGYTLIYQSEVRGLLLLYRKDSRNPFLRGGDQLSGNSTLPRKTEHSLLKIKQSTFLN